jgi:hypothetical protein
MRPSIIRSSDFSERTISINSIPSEDTAGGGGGGDFIYPDLSPGGICRLLLLIPDIAGTVLEIGFSSRHGSAEC